MEHIVQFAIGIDDQAIAKKIEENAEKAITKNLQDKVTRAMFGKYYYTDGTDEKILSAYVKDIFDKWVEKHKDEIIDASAKYLAEKLVRTKAGKEALKVLTDAD